MPIGISWSDKAERAIMSTSTIKLPPINTQPKISARLVTPTQRRTMWGIMSPTNPMPPQYATIHAVKAAHIPNAIKRMAVTLIPRVFAFSSPNNKASKRRPTSRRRSTLPITTGSMIHAYHNSVRARLPMSQKITLLAAKGSPKNHKK